MTPVKIAYGLYFLGYFTVITAFIGVVYAYWARGHDDVADSHFAYLIGAFWIALAGFALGLALLFLTLGRIILLVMFIWSMARLASGLARAIADKPVNMVRYFWAWAV